MFFCCFSFTEKKTLVEGHFVYLISTNSYNLEFHFTEVGVLVLMFETTVWWFTHLLTHTDNYRQLMYTKLIAMFIEPGR